MANNFTLAITSILVMMNRNKTFHMTSDTLLINLIKKNVEKDRLFLFFFFLADWLISVKGRFSLVQRKIHIGSQNLFSLLTWPSTFEDEGDYYHFVLTTKYIKMNAYKIFLLISIVQAKFIHNFRSYFQNW